MTDISQETPAATTAQQLPPEAQQQINLFIAKQQMTQKIMEEWNNFKKSINALPLPQYHKHNAFVELDTALLWIKEGILAFVPQQPSQVTPSQSSTPASSTCDSENSTASNESTNTTIPVAGGGSVLQDSTAASANDPAVTTLEQPTSA